MSPLNFLFLIFISGCMAVGDPPVIDRSVSQKGAKEKYQKKRLGIFRANTIYVVKKGDTLYSIAWKKGLSYGFLAEQNNIAAPFIIYPGQQLKVSGFKKGRTFVKANIDKLPDRNFSSNKKPEDSYKTESSRKTGWVWPLNIRPALEFSKNNKGLDYTLVKAASLRAAGSGNVVYEGGGIGGFKNLIIIKHSSELLSAYSFNGGAQVAERQSVKSGDILARITPVTEKDENVHFEVRKNGRPIDPAILIKVAI